MIGSSEGQQVLLRLSDVALDLLDTARDPDQSRQAFIREAMLRQALERLEESQDAVTSTQPAA